MGLRAAVLALLALLGLTSGVLPPAQTAAAAEAARTARVPVPTPPKGKGGKCVAETDFMRRYHMTVLDHQRDDTVHEGIRTKRFSLKACVACHAVEGVDARPVGFENPKHFCRSCHDYAAVRIDCFECHASRPGEKSRISARDPAGMTALADYLKEAGR